MFHPPEMFPTLFPLSSTIKSFQAPFATVPFSDDSVRPVGAAGAGAGKLSPGSKSVGRYVPLAIVESSGSELATESSNVRFRLLTGFPPPTSDIKTTDRPLGLTRRTSTSSGDEWLKFLRLTTRRETGLLWSATAISDG